MYYVPLMRLVLTCYSVRGRAMKMSNVQVVPFSPTRISVKDFGPVKEADIHLGKVTVLMGPNNTGKTYITVLMPVLEQLARGWRFAQAMMAPPKYTLEDFTMLYLDREVLDAMRRFYSVNNPEELVRRGAERA